MDNQTPDSIPMVVSKDDMLRELAMMQEAVDWEEKTAETETCGGLAGETAQRVGAPS
jgi:hypothetical protein